MSPFLAWGDFHARSRFARSTIPEEKWGTTRSLQPNVFSHVVCKFIGTKESVNIRKEFDFHKIGLEHQHVPRFMLGVASCESV